MPFLFEQYANQEIDLDLYRAGKDTIEKRCYTLNKEIEFLEDRAKYLTKLYEYVKSNSINVLRYIGSTELTCELADIFISRVIVHKGQRVEIEWNFSDLPYSSDLSQEHEFK